MTVQQAYEALHALMALGHTDTELGVYETESDTELVIDSIEYDDGPVVKVHR